MAFLGEGGGKENVGILMRVNEIGAPPPGGTPGRKTPIILVRRCL